jgi:hypothetical protein
MADLETWDRLERVELTEADASVDEIDDLLDVDADGVIDPAADRAELHQFIGLATDAVDLSAEPDLAAVETLRSAVAGDIGRLDEG